VSSTADAFLELHPELAETDETSRATLDRNARLSSALAAYFRFSMSGWEHVPAGPCLVVANHSIGSPFVLPLLARAWHRQLPDRPARGLMHRVAWQWPFRQLGLLQRLGGIYAHPEVAARALARGHSLLVFPGGEFDAMRPFHERYLVKFGDRTGFTRLARAAGVPMVPLAICGSQAAYVTLPGAERVASLLALRRWTGLKRYPLTLGQVGLAATLAVPPLWPLSPLAFLAAAIPWPTRIEARLLPAMQVAANESDGESAERVRQALEAALTTMAQGRATFLG
jgi:1-acyl-sn-glycerol-3-phosphate acyltransferase